MRRRLSRLPIPGFKVLDLATRFQRRNEPSRLLSPPRPGFKGRHWVPVFGINLGVLAPRAILRTRVSIKRPFEPVAEPVKPLLKFEFFGQNSFRQELADPLVECPKFIDRHTLPIGFLHMSLDIINELRI